MVAHFHHCIEQLDLAAEQLSEIVKKYCGKDGLTFALKKQLVETSKLLRAAKPIPARTFSTALNESAENRLDKLNHNLDFLTTDSPGEPSIEDVIFHVQAWPFLFSDEAKEFIRSKSKECEIKTFDDAMTFLRKNWSPPILRNPLPRWRGRAARLKAETSTLKILEKYQRLMDEMDFFDKKVNDSAMALDTHIQHQIDLMRGK